MKIKLEIELDYDADLHHAEDNIAREWFFNEVLCGQKRDDLILHSNEIGDSIGTVKVLKILNP